MSLKVSQKFLVAVAVPVVFELALVGTLFFFLAQADEARRRESQAKDLASSAYRMIGLHVQRMTELMIYKSTEDPAMLAKAQITADKMLGESIRIHNVVLRSTKSNETWNKLDTLVRQIGAEHKQALDRLKAGDKSGFAQLYGPMRKHFDDMMLTIDELTAQQTQTKGIDVTGYIELARYALYVSLLLSLVTAFMLAYVFNTGTAERLKVIMDNTERLAAGQPPARALRGDDELAQIDRLYHGMYDSLAMLRRRERAILENVADVVCSIDSGIRFTDINEACHKLWGYQQEQLIGGRPVEFVEEEDRELVIQSLKKAIELGQEARFECRLKRHDGTTADTEWSATWSKEENSLYCVIHDISARKHLDRLKRDFVSMISHEIRTPLTSIQLTHSILAVELGEEVDEFLSNSLNAAQDNVNRLMALVNNLLDLDKLESGLIDFIAEPIPAKETVETSVSAIDALLRQKSIKITLDVDSEITFYADKDRLIQVMINLLGNAIKYSPPQSEITIAVQRQGDFVRVSVRDQGRGIPKDKLETVFERFRQVEAADQRVHKGIGLGLAISRAIVERHRGDMGVESVEGQGSTFWFTIPASESIYRSLDSRTQSVS
jgi:PAS domain S-box-containing protein